MRSIQYVVTKEGEHYVAQCLNVDVSTFGDSIDEAVRNIREAVELYFEDHDPADFVPIELAMIGESTIHG